MPDLLERTETTPLMRGANTTAAPDKAIGIEGWPSLLELEESRVYMNTGPTGWNAYWPEVFAFLHPDLATTDSALNGVDDIWLPQSSPRIQIWLELKALPLPRVGEVVQRMRSATDLPVAQLAAMCGIKRRQFYNLLDGGGASATRERWIRSLADALDDVSDAAGGESSQVRAAILRPLNGISLFDIATAEDYDGLRDMTLRLTELLRTGKLPSRVRRPVLRSREADSERRTTEFLAGIRMAKRTTAENEIEPLHPRLAELLAAGADEEQEVLHEILRSGVDQGCFCRPSDEDLISPDPAQLQKFLDAVENRPDVALTEADPWATEEPPASAIEKDRPGWVVLPQRCDLVRCYRREPLVEVANARLLTEPGEVRSARLNSPRWIAFADGPGKSIWAVDLRNRVTIAKHRLIGQPDLTQPIPDGRRRKQFRLRLGQRYWRDPVPTDLVEALQRPLVRQLAKSGSRTALTERFVALLGQRTDDGLVIVAAVLEPSGDRREAEKEWREIVDLLHEHEPDAAALIEPEDSGVYDVDDVSLGYWLDAFKFDLDEVTYGKKAGDDQAAPAV